MLDERDLQAIAQLIDSKLQESEQRTSQLIDSKLKESEQRTMGAIKESEQRTMQGAAALMESYFEPKFQLLAEGIQSLQETQIPRERFENLEEEVAFLHTIVRQHGREIEKLKHRGCSEKDIATVSFCARGKIGSFHFALDAV